MASHVSSSSSSSSSTSETAGTSSSTASYATSKVETSVKKAMFEDEEMEARRVKTIEEREAKRERMKQAMAKRRKARQGGAAEASKERKRMTDAFMAEFNRLIDSIESDIESSSTYDEFQVLKKRGVDLEEKLADAARFLPPFLIESRGAMIQKLRQKIDDTQATRAPAPKFTLKRTMHSALKDVSSAEDQIVDSSIGDESCKSSVITSAAMGADDGDGSDVVDVVKETEKDDPSITDEVLIQGLSLQTIYKEPGSVDGSDVSLSKLKYCTVSIADVSGAMRLSDLEHCTVICGPISGSLHAEHVRHCTIHAAMRQCRIHHTMDTSFYILSNSDPIIEDTTDVRFAPYVVRYPELDEHWKQCDQLLDPSINLWDQVKDFRWIKRTQSPNWAIIPPDERMSEVSPVETLDEEDEL